jgi:hypothetical protein
MTLGAGLIEGQLTDVLVGFRPGDLAYEDHTGAVFHEQNEAGGGNVAFYEIQNQGDQIDINLGNIIFGMDQPVVVIHTSWGSTEYDVVERSSGNAFISERSGFGSDVWPIDVQATDGKIRLTNFADTTAAFLPVLSVFDLAE